MTDWKQAACIGVPGLFFEATNDKGEVIETPEDTAAREDVAKAICADCAIRLDCLAASRGEKFGVWGGLTARERRRPVVGSRP